MDISRRAALLMAGGAAAWFGLRRFAGTTERAYADTKNANTEIKELAPNRPRYWVFVLASGGWDAILTLDPKTKREVEPDVDVPYGPKDIVGGGGVPLGPHFAPLHRWAKQMAVVKGVKVSAANHEYCWMQWGRLKRVVQPSMPSIMDLLGQKRTGQPLAGIWLGPTVPYDYSSGFIGTRGNYLGDPVGFKYGVYNDDQQRLFDDLDKMAPEDFAVMARALRKNEHYLDGLGGPRNLRAAQSADDVAALFENMHRYSKFEAQDWGSTAASDGIGGYGETANARIGIAHDFQRALWVLNNDVAKTIFMRVGVLDWDTHAGNLPRQTTWNGHFAVTLDKFIEQLHAMSNEHGTLASQTTIVVGSELGRFPKLNPYAGKDHFPETPHMFIGPNINCGSDGAVFGATDREMVGLPVDLRTGKPSKGGTSVTLDDLGTTMLTMDGIRPDTYGYSGRMLHFLGA